MLVWPWATLVPSFIKLHVHWKVLSHLCSQGYFRLVLPLVTLTSKINRVHLLILWNICAKGDKNTPNSTLFCLQGYISVHCNPGIWHKNNQGSSFHLLQHLYKVWLKYIKWCLSIVFTRFFPYLCLLWPWPLTSKINKIYPLTLDNICAKLDHNSLTGMPSIVLTRLHSPISLYNPLCIHV